MHPYTLTLINIYIFTFNTVNHLVTYTKTLIGLFTYKYTNLNTYWHPHIQTYLYTDINTYTRTHIHVQTKTRIRTYTHTHLYKHFLTYTQLSYIHTLIRANKDTFIFEKVHKHKPRYTHLLIQTYTNIILNTYPHIH